MKALYYSVLKYQPENLALLREHFDVVELDSPADDTEETLRDIEVAFAPLGYTFGKEKIDTMPKLRCIASNTTGEPHIDRAYAESKNIVVCSLKDEQEFLATITPTAEHTWGLLLALMRRTPWAHSATLEGKWDRRPWGGRAMLSRLSVGIAGYGRLGKLVGEYAKAFNMPSVRFYDPHAEEATEGIEKVQTLEKLVADADIVSVHIPATLETHKIFDAKLFSRFKKGAYFVNTARGELVDEVAMLAALESGQLAGVALDVFDGEYGEGGEGRWQKNPLRSYAQTHDNLLITPHIGGSTIDAWRETERRTIELVLAAVQKI